MGNPNFRQHDFVGSVICNIYATRDKILTFNNRSSICSTNSERAHYLLRKCMCIYIYMYNIYMHMYIYMHICMYIYIGTHIYASVYICIQIDTLYLAFNASQNSYCAAYQRKHSPCILSGNLALNRQPIRLASLSQKTVRKEGNKSHLKCNNA